MVRKGDLRGGVVNGKVAGDYCTIRSNSKKVCKFYISSNIIFIYFSLYKNGLYIKFINLFMF